MPKPINIGLEEPFHKGYVVIPKAWLDKAIELTEDLSVVPNISGVSTKDKRRIKTLFIAIDMLNKIKNKSDVITAEKISELLDIDPSDVNELLEDAKRSGLIEEGKTGNLIIRCTKRYVEKASPKKKPGEHKQLVDLYHDKFLAKFKEKPSFVTQDFTVATSLVSKYSIEELSVIIDKYFELDDQFLKSSGYKLRFMSNSINAIAVANSDNKKGRRGKKIYKGKDYIDEFSDEQLQDYVKGKKEGKWTGKETWAVDYEEALKNSEDR